MTLGLSAEFHRWSRLYPEEWRAGSSAAMLGTCLDVADAEGRTRLTRGEKAGLVAGGLDARVDVLVPRRVRDLVSTVMVSLLGAYSLVVGVGIEWAPWFSQQDRTHGIHQYWGGGDMPSTLVMTFGPFLSPFAVVAALAIVAWVLSMVGPGWLYRSVLIATVVAGLVVAGLATFGPLQFFFLGDGATPIFAVIVAFLALLGERPRPGRILLGTVAWIVAIVGTWQLLGPDWPLYARSSGVMPLQWVWGELISQSALFWGLLLSLVAAAVLAILRRGIAAAAVIVCGLPWALLGLYLLSMGTGQLEVLPLTAYSLAVIIAVALGLGARHRARSAGPDASIGE